VALPSGCLTQTRYRHVRLTLSYLQVCRLHRSVFMSSCAAKIPPPNVIRSSQPVAARLPHTPASPAPSSMSNETTTKKMTANDSSPMNIATISAGFEKGDFLVREEQGNRVYFDFFEEVRQP
jgi:hypothetical protein